MAQAVSALRIMGTVLLGATELVLVALFAVAVAADNSNINQTGCLLLHCAANLLVWTNEVYIILRRGRDPRDIAYIVFSTALVIVTAIAFALFAFYLAETGSTNGKVDFATMGAPVAYAVLILSWLVTMLAIQSLVFAGADKYYACFSSNASRPTGQENSQSQRRPARKQQIDLSRRPLPVTIVNVVQNGERELHRHSTFVIAGPEETRLKELERALQLPPPPFKTTDNHLPAAGQV